MKSVNTAEAGFWGPEESWKIQLDRKQKKKEMMHCQGVEVLTNAVDGGIWKTAPYTKA